MTKIRVKRKKINWFKLNRALHRDIGYLCIGLTLLFGISGIAVNHMEDWNPNYEVIVEKIPLAGIKSFAESDKFTDEVVKRLKVKNKLKSSYWASPNEFKLFFKESFNVSVNLEKEEATTEKVTPRFLLKRFNDLHLNNPKKVWTFVSDLFAICLIYLAISALFMVKGKKGIKGRGGILTIIGFIIPFIFILLYT